MRASTDTFSGFVLRGWLEFDLVQPQLGENSITVAHQQAMGQHSPGDFAVFAELDLARIDPWIGEHLQRDQPTCFWMENETRFYHVERTHQDVEHLVSIH